MNFSKNQMSNTLSSLRPSALLSRFKYFLWRLYHSSGKQHRVQLLKDCCYVLLLASCLTPAWAQGIWGGRLCTAFQYVVNSELITAVILIASAGVLIVWFLDDGKSNLKLNALRIAAGGAALVGLPTVISLVTGTNVMCKIGM